MPFFAGTPLKSARFGGSWQNRRRFANRRQFRSDWICRSRVPLTETRRTMPRSPDDIRDELLVLRCRRGETAAWDELVHRYNGRLFYYVRRMVDRDDQAAAVLQQVWLQVLESFSKLRQGDRLPPGLFNLPRDLGRSHYRQR